MRRLIVLFFCIGIAGVRAELLRVTSWNLNFDAAAFSGTEEKRLADMAAVLRPLDADVILLQEVPDRQVCDKLAALLTPARYQVAVCSDFADVDGHGFSQVAILSRKPVVAAWTEPWHPEDEVLPPGGFAFAAIHHGSSEVGLFAVQLKNNLTDGDFELDTQLNIFERELSAAQLARQIGSLDKKLTNQLAGVVIAGTFNTDEAYPLFVSENTLRLFLQAGFINVFHGLPRESRVTYHGHRTYPEATFDYLLARNAENPTPPQVTPTTLSAHFPVTSDLVIQPPVLSAPPPSPNLIAVNRESFAFAAVLLLLIISWWWLVSRKKYYSPPAVPLLDGLGEDKLLSFSDTAESVAEPPPTMEQSVSEKWLLRKKIAAHDCVPSQILSLQQRAAAAEQRAAHATQLARNGILPHLIQFMKGRLFQGVASQREQLLITQQVATQRVTELERRLMIIQSQLQGRFNAYEDRIVKLEKEVAAKEFAYRELLNSRIELVQPNFDVPNGEPAFTPQAKSLA